MNTEKREKSVSLVPQISMATEGKTDSHDPFECPWLSSRVPLEAVESVIIPEMLCKKAQELYVRSG